jgi:hypothetical protein
MIQFSNVLGKRSRNAGSLVTESGSDPVQDIWTSPDAPDADNAHAAHVCEGGVPPLKGIAQWAAHDAGEDNRGCGSGNSPEPISSVSQDHR